VGPAGTAENRPRRHPGWPFVNRRTWHFGKAKPRYVSELVRFREGASSLCPRNRRTGARAHLGVARANALQARTFQGQGQGADAAACVRALAAYKDLLTLWKDADPDIPILKQAKAEYAKL
jgi:hypothetical protein